MKLKTMKKMFAGIAIAKFLFGILLGIIGIIVIIILLFSGWTNPFNMAEKKAAAEQEYHSNVSALFEDADRRLDEIRADPSLPEIEESKETTESEIEFYDVDDETYYASLRVFED